MLSRKNVEKSRYSENHKLDVIRTNPPTVITADGKVKWKKTVLSKEADSQSKKKVQSILKHLTKITKGCFSSSMREDTEYAQFCEDAIGTLIEKKTEELCKLGQDNKPVVAHKIPKNADKVLNMNKVLNRSERSEIVRESLRSDDRVLDFMELENDKSLSREDRFNLQGKVFQYHDGDNKLLTDHFPRYVAEQLKHMGSPGLKEKMEKLDLENKNIKRLKEILRKEKEVEVEEARKSLAEKMKKLKGRKKKEAKIIKKKSVKRKKKVVKKTTEKKVVVKKKTKKRVAKKRSSIR